MSKTLTEQWREGTLPKGLYYTRSSSGRKGFSFHTGSKRNMFSPYDRMAHQIEQVLAPVPSYDEYKRLQEKLRIATKALEEIKEKLLHVELSRLDGDNRQKMYDLMFEDGVIDKSQERIMKGNYNENI